MARLRRVGLLALGELLVELLLVLLHPRVDVGLAGVRAAQRAAHDSLTGIHATVAVS